MLEDMAALAAPRRDRLRQSARARRAARDASRAALRAGRDRARSAPRTRACATIQHRVDLVTGSLYLLANLARAEEQGVR